MSTNNQDQSKKILELPVLIIRDGLPLPGTVLAINVARRQSLALVSKILEEAPDQIIASFVQKSPELNTPTLDDVYPLGTTSKITKVLEKGPKFISIAVEGISPIRLLEPVTTNPFPIAKVEVIESDPIPDDDEYKASLIALLEMFQRFLDLLPHAKRNIPPGTLPLKPSDTLPYEIMASLIYTNTPDRLKILEITDPRKRIDYVMNKLYREIELLRMAKKIYENITQQQRQFERERFLREQLKLLQAELGEMDATTKEINEFRKKIENSKMPDKVKEIALKELDRMSLMSPQMPEYSVIRSYLTWLVEMPWGIYTEDNLDIENARKVLNKTHYGLEKVKERILEFIATGKLKGGVSGSIIALIGPPGVGKTSLGKAIAQALGRKYFRISLGGVSDEAEIRGHRRTYIGAMPGQIVQGLRRLGVANPVLQIDEIDKIGLHFGRGDVAAALLEVLDPEQNTEFIDHYLDVPFDLSKILFIATGNQMDTLPPALIDRMEIIEVNGYTLREKLHIAKYFLLPKKISETGLKPYNIKITDKAIEKIITYYTKEAGVRNLEREIGRLCRAVALDIVKENNLNKTVSINANNLTKYLGREKFLQEKRERSLAPGVAIGLAWTPVGGDILYVETALIPGKGDLKLTGQLGDVMRESAEAALSYILSRAKQLDIDLKLIENNHVHVHVPMGAIPKDGPSAGITIMVAVVSLLKNMPISSTLALTGEITLRGKVLPVGGIKEKVLAAHRSGIKTIIMPADNRRDVDLDIPQYVRKDIKFIYVTEMDEVVSIVFNSKIK